MTGPSTKVHAGRFTAVGQHDFVIFIIGMRVNKWFKLHKWLPTAMAMPRMLARLESDKTLGMLSGENFFRLFPLTTTLISYWRSFEDLERFATDKTLPHAKEWAKFMKLVGSSGDVGIYHETFKVKKGDFECIYGNMPRFGLSAAFDHVAIGKGAETARERIER